MLAEEIGVGHTTVQRVWKEHGLKPHLTRPFKLSNDPKFAEKVVDIVGLYLNPPDKAVVLCVDEKSQIQALDRTQPGLPMKKGRAQTMTHDYKRNGTTTLFAALDVKTGEVIGECLPRHRAKEFIRFRNCPGWATAIVSDRFPRLRRRFPIQESDESRNAERAVDGRPGRADSGLRAENASLKAENASLRAQMAERRALRTRQHLHSPRRPSR
jgi:hypothetical protein